MRVCFAGYEGLLTDLVRQMLSGELDVFNLRLVQLVEQVADRVLCPDSPYDADDASSQLVLCASLLRLKSRKLLPAKRRQDEDDRAEELLPELEEAMVVQKLAEYQHFQTVAGILEERAHESSKLFPRGFQEKPEGEDSLDLSHVSLLSLVAALEQALDSGVVTTMTIEDEEFTLREGLDHLRTVFTMSKQVRFLDVFPAGASRLVIVVVFLGVLEMIRTGEILVSEAQDEILFFRKGG